MKYLAEEDVKDIENFIVNTKESDLPNTDTEAKEQGDVNTMNDNNNNNNLLKEEAKVEADTRLIINISVNTPKRLKENNSYSDVETTKPFPLQKSKSNIKQKNNVNGYNSDVSGNRRERNLKKSPINFVTKSFSKQRDGKIYWHPQERKFWPTKIEPKEINYEGAIFPDQKANSVTFVLDVNYKKYGAFAIFEVLLDEFAMKRHKCESMPVLMPLNPNSNEFVERLKLIKYLQEIKQEIFTDLNFTYIAYNPILSEIVTKIEFEYQQHC